MKGKIIKTTRGVQVGKATLLSFTWAGNLPHAVHSRSPLCHPTYFSFISLKRMSLENSETGCVNRATMTNYGAEMLRKSDIWRWQAAPENKVRLRRKKQLQRRRCGQVCAESSLAILTICLPGEDWTNLGERGGNPLGVCLVQSEAWYGLKSLENGGAAWVVLQAVMRSLAVS